MLYQVENLCDGEWRPGMLLEMQPAHLSSYLDVLSKRRNIHSLTAIGLKLDRAPTTRVQRYTGDDAPDFVFDGNNLLFVENV